MWGGRPGPRRPPRPRRPLVRAGPLVRAVPLVRAAPSSAPAPWSGSSVAKKKADEGVGRGPGGPPHLSLKQVEISDGLH